MIDDSWWFGTIKARDSVKNHFQVLQVLWDNGEEERMSPWDLEPIDTSSKFLDWILAFDFINDFYSFQNVVRKRLRAFPQHPKIYFDWAATQRKRTNGLSTGWKLKWSGCSRESIESWNSPWPNRSQRLWI